MAKTTTPKPASTAGPTVTDYNDFEGTAPTVGGDELGAEMADVMPNAIQVEADALAAEMEGTSAAQRPGKTADKAVNGDSMDLSAPTPEEAAATYAEADDTFTYNLGDVKVVAKKYPKFNEFPAMAPGASEVVSALYRRKIIVRKVTNAAGERVYRVFNKALA